MAISLLLAAMCGAANAGLADVLERPAVPSARSLHAAMMSVARAGKRLIGVGERGVVLISDDDGRNWRQAKVPVSTALTQVVFIDDRQGWAAGHSGIVLNSRDGGETWNKLLDGREAARIELDAAKASGNAQRLIEAERLVADGPDKPFLGLHFDDDRRGFVVGAYGLALRTSDGGRTWQSMMGGIDNPRGRHHYAVVRSGRDLYLCGEQGQLFRSGDDGASFAILHTGSKGTFFGLVDGPDGELLAYGLRGALFRSVDQGRNWQKLDMPPTSLTASLRMPDGAVVLADEVGHVLRQRKDGRSFEAFGAPPTYPVAGLALAADGSVILAGARSLSRAPLAGNGEGVK